MLALVLAAALAGPPAPADPAVALLQARVDENRRIADGVAFDSIIIGGGVGFDLYTTGKCAHDNPFCFEANPAVQNSNGLQIVALKAAAFPAYVGIDYFLRSKGHHKTARIFAIATAVVHAAVGVHNLDVANDSKR